MDAAASLGTLLPFWTWFGYDEANYTYFRDGNQLLGDLARLSATPIHIRTHNLLTTREGDVDRKWGFTDVYREDAEGNPRYDWTLVDRVFDTFVRLGIKPVVEMGFMPKALSTRPNPYRRDWVRTGDLWAGWSYPPTNYSKWHQLIARWVDHSVERYGQKEVETWLWEPWNEPNIGYWQGSLPEFFELYDHSVAAVKERCPRCLVGGPHTTNPDAPEAAKALSAFLEHCASGKNAATGVTGAPLDFVAFHAKGHPEEVNGSVRMNMAPQLAAVKKGFELVQSFPQFRGLPVLLGEFDPEGCAACSVGKHPQYAYRNGTLYPAYTAASHTRVLELAEAHSIRLLGILTWGFEFENQPYFDGFRDLSTNGVHKPIFNLFRMLGLLPQQQRLSVTSSQAFSAAQIMKDGVRGEHGDIGALASRDSESIAALVWHYHDDATPGPSQAVSLRFDHVPFERVSVRHFRIDETHSNAFTQWQRLGMPQVPTADEYGALQAAAELDELVPTEIHSVARQQLRLDFSLPRQALSLVTLTNADTSL